MGRRSWVARLRSTLIRRSEAKIDPKVPDRQYNPMIAAGARKSVHRGTRKKEKVTHTSSIDGSERMQQSTSRALQKKIVGCMSVVCHEFRTRTQSTRRCVRCLKITRCECSYISLPLTNPFTP